MEEFQGWLEDGTEVFGMTQEIEDELSVSDADWGLIDRQAEAQIARFEREQENFEVPPHWEP